MQASLPLSSVEEVADSSEMKLFFIHVFFEVKLCRAKCGVVRGIEDKVFMGKDCKTKDCEIRDCGAKDLETKDCEAKVGNAVVIGAKIGKIL